MLCVCVCRGGVDGYKAQYRLLYSDGYVVKGSGMFHITVKVSYATDALIFLIK